MALRCFLRVAFVPRQSSLNLMRAPTLFARNLSFAQPTESHKLKQRLDELGQQPASAKLRQFNKFLNRTNHSLNDLEELLSFAKSNQLELFQVYKQLLFTCFDIKNYEKAEKIFRDAHADNVQFEPIEWEKIMKKFAVSRKPRMRMLGAMANIEAPKTLFDYNMSLYQALSSDITKMNQLMDQLIQNQIEPDSFTYDLMIKKAFKERNPQEALGFFRQAHHKRVSLMPATYQLLLVKIPESSEHNIIFNDAISHGLYPTTMMVNVILADLVNNLPEAHTLWRKYFARNDQGKFDNLTPSVSSYQYLMSAYLIALNNKTVDKDIGVHAMEEIYHQLSIENKRITIPEGSHLKMLNAYTITHHPNAILFFRDFFVHMNSVDQSDAVTLMLKMAVETRQIDIASAVINAQPPVTMQAVDYYYLGCLYHDLDDLAAAVKCVENMGRKTDFLLKYPQQSLKDKIIKENRTDLLLRFERAVTKP